MQMANTHTGVYLPSGVTDEGARQHLSRWAATRVLDVRNLLPGTFGGFTNASAALMLDNDVFPLYADKKWCCSGEQPMEVRSLMCCSCLGLMGGGMHVQMWVSEGGSSSWAVHRVAVSPTTLPCASKRTCAVT